jgi:hypothetical protein
VKSKVAIDRLRCPITRPCSPYAKGFTKHVIPLGPLAQSIWTSAIADRTYVFGKWDTGFSNYTHLKESFDEKLKFNEGWWVPRSAPHGETAMSEHLSEAILNHGKKDMEQRGLYPTKARRVDQVGARDRARAKPNETAC